MHHGDKKTGAKAQDLVGGTIKMTDYTEYIELLKTRLTEKRFNHSLGVMETSGRLAEHYGCDVEKARLTGLLHDVTKKCSEEEQLEMFKKYNISNR